MTVATPASQSALYMDPIVCDRLIADIDEVVTRQMVAITDHEQFRNLRDAWFGMYLLLEASGDLESCYVEFLSMTREDLEEDFDENPDLTTSGLWYHMYITEYDQAGGQPYDAMLMQWSFQHRRSDVSFLKQLSRIAAGCHCPVITNPDPALFQIDNLSRLEEIRSFDALFDSVEYSRWRSLRDSPDSRYLAMVLPGAFHPMHHSKTRPMWCRDPRMANADQARIHGSLLFGMLLARSFHQYGWCVQIRGPYTGGLLPYPPATRTDIPGLTLYDPPTEINFSDARERELAEQGFVVLNYFRKLKQLCVFSAPTIQQHLRTRNRGDDRLAASLPYVLLISRVAHYQRVIQRENVGTIKDAAILQKELSNWLEQYITRAVYPDQEQRARAPLREGSMVEVIEDESSPGFFNVRLTIRPHIQLEGVCAGLTLVSKMPKLEG